LKKWRGTIEFRPEKLERKGARHPSAFLPHGKWDTSGRLRAFRCDAGIPPHPLRELRVFISSEPEVQMIFGLANPFALKVSANVCDDV
jgi:hypothetical protein